MSGIRALPLSPRALAWLLAGVGLIGVVWLMAVAAPTDPTAVTAPQSEGSVIVNAAVIVFREGLEAVLIFAAVIASFRGAERARMRPVVGGAAVAFGATVVTWFAARALLDVASPLGPRLEAITGFLAIAVLLVVLNWFVHKAYWSEWIGSHHRRRRQLLAQTGIGATLGLVLLGFTSVYREGFETVLFLQNLELRSGTGAALGGVAIGLAATAVVGLVTFWLHRRMPYRRMLVWTGILVGGVLVVMIGGTALTFEELGWLPSHATPFPVPEWLGSWLEVYPTWESIGAQLAAAAFVIGSYVLARHLQTRPQGAGEERPQGARAAAETVGAPEG